jgi:hypothetical protein
MTSVKILSTTLSHTKQNTFSSIQRLYDEAVIPLPGVKQTEYIGLDTRDRHGSLSMLFIQEGESGKNTLQGMHPIPRATPHAKLGVSSRVRVFVDEAEFSGAFVVWPGIHNILSTVQRLDTVKIIMACNPQRPESMVGHRL